MRIRIILVIIFILNISILLGAKKKVIILSDGKGNIICYDMIGKKTYKESFGDDNRVFKIYELKDNTIIIWLDNLYNFKSIVGVINIKNKQKDIIKLDDKYPFVNYMIRSKNLKGIYFRVSELDNNHFTILNEEEKLKHSTCYYWEPGQSSKKEVTYSELMSNRNKNSKRRRWIRFGNFIDYPHAKRNKLENKLRLYKKKINLNDNRVKISYGKDILLYKTNNKLSIINLKNGEEYEISETVSDGITLLIIGDDF